MDRKDSVLKVSNLHVQINHKRLLESSRCRWHISSLLGY